MESIFEAWSATRTCDHVAPLTPASVKNYRFIWAAWLHFLSSSNLDWDCASPHDVRGFLREIKPSASNHSLPSSVSQKRYARILRDVYAFAVVNSRAAKNPVTPSALISFTEQQDSMVFTEQTWEKIKALPAYSDAQANALTWEAARNHAMLHLLILAALQVTEMQDLTGQDCLTNEAGAVDRVAIRGARPSQNRIVILCPLSATAMEQWVRVRSVRLAATKNTHLPLFLSRKMHGKLSAKSIFWIAREYLDSTLAQNEHPDRRSPGVLRNTRISEWLKTESPVLVARKAGLRDVTSLSRLRAGFF